MPGLEESYRFVRRRYGDDIAQEAYHELLAGRHVLQPAAYLRKTAQLLSAAGYHDGRISHAHHHTWGREVLNTMVGDGPHPLWTSPAVNPARHAIAREALREIPAWLIAAHVEDGLVVRRRCAHAYDQWYLSRYANGAQRLRCRGCVAVHSRRAELRGGTDGGDD